MIFPFAWEPDLLEGRRAWRVDWFCVEKVLVGKKMKMEMILIRAGNLRCWGDVFMFRWLTEGRGYRWCRSAVLLESVKDPP